MAQHVFARISTDVDNIFIYSAFVHCHVLLDQSNVGLQHYVIGTDRPYGLGLNEKLMPQYLKEAGYDTHMIGKWHLGFYKKEYTPTFRGFDSHVGILCSGVDYYNHSNNVVVLLKNYILQSFCYSTLFRVLIGTAMI